MLGLGLGLNKGGYIKPLPKYLTDAGCTFAINVDRQVKALANPNSPFINPLVDVVGKLGKNLFDLYSGLLYRQGFTQNSAIENNGIKLIGAPSSNIAGIVVKLEVGKTYYLKTNRYLGSGVVRVYPQDSKPLISFPTPYSSIPISISGSFVATKEWNIIGMFTGSETTGTHISDIQLEEYGFSTYEPYGFNNVLLQPFAGTTADGYTQIALPNGKNPWFLKFDGTDSLGIMANTADVDILGTNDFAISTVFMTSATLNNTVLICKNESTESESQYFIILVSTGRIYAYFGGQFVELAVAGTVLPNTLYHLIVYRKSGTLINKLNQVETKNTALSINITSKPNLRIGARSSNVGGTTHTGFANINLGNLAIFYSGSNGLDISAVEKAVAKFNANYI